MKDGTAEEELGESRTSTFRTLWWLACSPQPRIGQLTTGAERLGRLGSPGAAESSSAGKPRPDPRPLGTSTRARVASCPPQYPPGVSGAAGLPWAPGGPPRHGGCAPRLSGGRGRSHGLSSHAALGPGLIPPHTAPRGQPRRPSPSFPAVQAPKLHTGRPPRSPQGLGPRTMTRTPVSLNTGP